MKSIFRSKTLWFNFLTVVMVVATSFGYTPDPEVARHATNILLVVAPLINMVLRLVTTKPVSVTTG